MSSSLHLLKGETYSDLVNAFVANIFSKGAIVEAENRAIPSKNLSGDINMSII